MAGGPLPRIGCRGRARAVPVQPGIEAPGVAEPVMVVVALERREHPRDRVRGLLGAALGDVQQAQEVQLHEHARLGALVADARRHEPRVLEHPVGLREPAGRDQRRADLGQQLGAPLHVVRRERRRALEQADRSGQVAARERPAAGLLEAQRRPRAEALEIVVGRAELQEAAVGLLEVVADDLLELAEAVRRPCARARPRAARAARRAWRARASGTRHRGSGGAGSDTPRRPRSFALLGPDHVAAHECRDAPLEEGLRSPRARARGSRCGGRPRPPPRPGRGRRARRAAGPRAGRRAAS